MAIQRDFVKENILDRLDELARRVRVLEETVFTTAAFIGASYRTDAGQSISDATTTIVDFEDKDYDSNDAVTTGASWKFTAPKSGYYHVTACVLFSSTTAWAETEVAILFIFQNGSLYAEMGRKAGLDSSGSATYQGISGSTTLYLSIGDYIDVRARQTTGGALALISDSYYNWVTVEKVG